MKTTFSPKDDLIIREAFDRGLLGTEIAELLHRPLVTTYYRIRQLGLSASRQRIWKRNFEKLPRGGTGVRRGGSKTEILISCPIQGESCLHPEPRWVVWSVSRRKSKFPGACRNCAITGVDNGDRVLGYSRSKHGHHRKVGFALWQLRMIDAIDICQFPGCHFRPKKSGRLVLMSDHSHGQCGHKADYVKCPECYRGEICPYHNTVMGVVDAFRDSFKLSSLAIRYANQRPFQSVASSSGRIHGS